MRKTSIAVRNEGLTRPVLLDGIARTGKFLLGKIVSGFDGVEHFQYVSLLEIVPYLERLGCISEDAAVSLLQINIDQSAYEMRIGRNLNLRYEDASSLYNSHDMNVYLQRSVSKLSEGIVERMTNDGRYSPFITHETFPNIQIFFKAFPKLKVVHLIRHPIDVAHSWYVRGWGHRFSNDPLAFKTLVKGPNLSVPWYVFGWETKYEEMSEMDRIIKSISTLTEMEEDAYKSLPEKQRDRIFVISYENLVESTGNAIKRMAHFLERNPSDGMGVILAREKCPKEISSVQRQTKLDEIKEMSSESGYRMMLDMVVRYERRMKEV